MTGITFGSYHSFDDFHLILNTKELGSPAIKERKIDIEGADSFLDLTDFFGGEPKYENVTHRFEFSTIVPQSDFISLFSSIKNALHGKRMRIILDDDSLFYYVGRLRVSSFTNDKNIGHVSIEADCEPFKYKLNKTVVSHTIDGTKAIVLTNGRKRAVPEVTVNGSIRIAHQGNTWSLGIGSFTLPELELVHGENALQIEGTGTITFEWQEGDL